MEKNQFDVIVIGGSFAGLSAALQIVRARRKVLVIDAGKPRNRFATAAHGFLSRDGQAPEQISRIGKEQFLDYPTAEFIEGKATRATRQGDGSFAVELESGAVYLGARLILATGITDQLPDIPGVRERWGKTVNHCPYCHGYELAGRKWGVLNVGEASLHQVKLMVDWSDDVTFFAQGDNRLSADERAELTKRNISIVDSPVKSLVGDSGTLERVELDNGQSVPLEALFLTTQTSINNPLIEQLGCELEAGPFGSMVKTNNFQETTVEGVYAAGDVARSMHTVTWAASDGVTAGAFAHQSLLAL
ncbi:NAD(P)/FAD-dependent oxidoreductase [cf. Phormidesmis sp. LEGE 11477]|uniref:NAD(P)/FAD-dependent oxidoreductase n=1 Tax=cf. Phormidesmis sp. LEGE 11477 TaxID=1828680 RepID=UPI001882E5F3|nr:NAD(P)/FAD-dependent oxidoreductase [cf. Phormidesmis sp. LEGE 11477]MBE9062984.1 NAD(P)/FAD-dependent oxidoreductase [cf. Phormidesmis sp. LEGE 11477]